MSFSLVGWLLRMLVHLINFRHKDLILGLELFTCLTTLGWSMMDPMYSGVPIKMSFSKSQWETFQDGQLWKPPESSKICIFPQCFYESIIFKLIHMYTKFQGQKMHSQKVTQNLPTLVDVEKFSLLPTLIASQSLSFFFFCNEIFGTKISLY
jgi:hypothetical protein